MNIGNDCPKNLWSCATRGKNFDVMRTMYAPRIVSVEGDGGRDRRPGSVIRKSEIWASENTIHGEKFGGPFFSGANQFAVHFTLKSHAKPAANASRWRRLASTQSRTARLRASNFTTKRPH